MPSFLSSPSTLSTTGWALSSWGTSGSNTVNLTGLVPSGSTGAILLVTCTATGGAANIGVRMTGSSDTWASTSAGVNSDSVAGVAGGRLLHCPLNGSLQFDIYTSSVTTTTYQIIGYWGSEATFLSAAVSAGSPGNGSYTSVGPMGSGSYTSIPSSAMAVIIAFSQAQGGQCGVRQLGAGDASGTGDSYYAGGSNILAQYNHAIVGLASGEFQTRTAVGTGTVYIIGYINSGTNFTWNANAINVTPSASGSLQSLTQESNATAYIYLLEGPGTNACGTAVIEGTGSSGVPAWLPGVGMGGAQYMCGANSQANLSTLTGMTLYELGYFYSSGGGGGSALGMMMGVGK